jgi:hypothetical protein
MTTINQADRITARQLEIGEELARLQEESNELAIALKVIKRLDADSPAVGSEPAKPAASDGSAKTKTPKLGPTRPSGCPTNFQMVDMILASAEKDGKDGLTVSEIINEMRHRSWPGLEDVQVSAPIYGFARKGRFRKTASGKFKRIKNSKDGPELGAEEAIHA